MGAAKIAITLDEKTLKILDRYVRSKHFPNRSRVIQLAVQEKLDRLDRTRLARECAKLDPAKERKDSELGLKEDSKKWPEY